MRNAVRKRRLGEVAPFGVLDGIFMAGNAWVAASLAGEVIELVDAHRESIILVEHVVRSENDEIKVAASIAADVANLAPMNFGAAAQHFEGESDAVPVHQGLLAAFEDFGAVARLCPPAIREAIEGAVVANGFADRGSAPPVRILIDPVREGRAKVIGVVDLRRDARVVANGVEMPGLLEEKGVVGAAQLAGRRVRPECIGRDGKRDEAKPDEMFGFH